MTPEELTRLRELHEQATPAPWGIDFETHPPADSDNLICAFKDAQGEDVIWQWGCGCCGIGLEAKNPTDFTLTVEARNSLPALLAEIERLQARERLLAARLARVNEIAPDAYLLALSAREGGAGNE